MSFVTANLLRRKAKGMVSKLSGILLEKLLGKPVVVWGARMTGIGFARYLKANGHRGITAFIDSDPAFRGKKVNEVPVYNPEKLTELRQQHKDLIIVIAVALKEHEVIEILSDLGAVESDYIVYSEYCTDFYTVDVVGTCNLKCPTCAHGSDGMESPLGLMPYQNFTQVVDKACNEANIVSHFSLYSWGEPLLHPDLGKMIDYLHQKGIAAAVSSNLSIKEEKYLRKMIQAGPEYLKVSLSGYYPDVYNQGHAGGDINLVKSNLYRLRYLIDKYHARTFVDVNYHLYAYNSGKNLKKMEELCEELNFSLSTTYALVMPLERVIGHCEGEPNPQLDGLRQKLLVDIDEGISASSGINMEGCPFRDNQININWDLTMPVCCTVFNRNTEAMLTDNYLENSIDDINRKKNQVVLCDKCMSYGLPAYNMGFNRDQWAKIAAAKDIYDG